LLLLELLAQGRDVPKLVIAVGRGNAFQRLLIDLERIPLLVQEVGQRCPLDAMARFMLPRLIPR
jgi:hypothetical protein